MQQEPRPMRISVFAAFRAAGSSVDLLSRFPASTRYSRSMPGTFSAVRWPKV